jgi:hypothetical protein
MGNVLERTKQEQVIALGRLGWSLRKIQAATGVRRETAGGYLRSAGILHLPALIRADFLALLAAAGASTLLTVQLVDVRVYRKVFEVGKIAPPLAPLHPPQLLFLRGLRRNIIGMERLTLQLLGEV